MEVIPAFAATYEAAHMTSLRPKHGVVTLFGYIVHGFDPNGPQSNFSRMLPRELVDTDALISKSSRRPRV